MSAQINEWYKSLGFELMKELAASLADEENLTFGGGLGAYQTLMLPNGMSVRFTRWRDGELPYYIILFDDSGRYVFELDLSMVVYFQGTFTWHLKIPSHQLNKAMLTDLLGPSAGFYSAYSESVKAVKADLGAGVNTPRNGYSFIEAEEWNSLSEQFVKLMGRAVAKHAGDDGSTPTIVQASDDTSDIFVRRKQRRNQAKFKLNLINQYGCKCAVTGETIAEIIEAAHIVAHAKAGVNHPDNGLLLRSDVHKLFDANLLAVNPDSLKVVVAPALKGTWYAGLAGRKLRAQVDGSYPATEYLRMKWEEVAFSLK
ncbi:HNH endonuclease [Chromohalobacter sp. 11-W]|uniref:HNH endonuclease n=1 Tax=Chromohalobacter sp. 11-W TaxID=2994061 RepID=UPI0024689E0B|nr:HNH endonuclease [Chromohalobacter sp. 11-W]